MKYVSSSIFALTLLQYSIVCHVYDLYGFNIICNMYNIYILMSQHSGLPLHTLWGGKCGDGVPLMQCISLLPPQDIAPLVQKFRKQGYKTFNIKLGEDAHTDIARLKAARNALGPECKVIGDANTGRIRLVWY